MDGDKEFSYSKSAKDTLGQSLEAAISMVAFGGTGEVIRINESRELPLDPRETILPADIGRDDLLVLQDAGVVFGEKLPEDSLFIRAILPRGWQKLAISGQTLRWKLVDDQGRKRALLYCTEGAAGLRASQRYTVQVVSSDDSDVVWAIVLDGDDKIIYSAREAYGDERYSHRYHEASESVTAAAYAWLKEHFPQFGDISAYWD